MRIKSLLLAVALVLSPAAFAQKPDFDFEALMETAEANLNEMQASISLEEKDSAIQYANELKAAFHQIEGFFATFSGAADAVQYSKEYQARSDRVVELVNAGKFDEAYEVSVDFSNHCKACHDSYKPL